MILADAAECENGWTQYKDELCIQALKPDLVTFDEAKDLCTSQGPSASLLMVKGPELQDFLTTYTSELYDNLWLGGKYNNETAEFHWIDGEPLTYTNWADGYPRHTNDSDACIYVRPPNTQTSTEAQWEDSACQRRNLAICQQPLVWNLQDAVDEIIRNRKELVSVKEELEETKEILAKVNSMVVPVGSIYIEYFNQPSPRTLWPEIIWEDVTSSYAGLFFRALGGNGETWGTTQASCAPRIVSAEYWEFGNESPSTIQIPENGWSEWGKIGVAFKSGTFVAESYRFNTNGCEKRPINQAVRIWKRIS